MALPVYVPLSSTLTTIVLDLVPMIEFDAIGGYAIDSYQLQYAVTNAWIDVQGQEGSFSLTTTVSVGSLTGGTTYKFRVRAHNIHGWGSWSNVLQEIASGIPTQPAPVAVHIVNLDVKIQWATPIENYATVTAYEVTILQSDGSTFTQQVQYCNGQSSMIVLQAYCLIPETVLRAAPYSL